jgi:hypothetical protein
MEQKTQSKTHWKKQHNYNYLGSYSLVPGNDMVLTIRELKPEEITGVNGKKENGFVCYFSENVKPMILNKTNCKIIEKVYGSPYIEDWVGKKIQLYVTQVSAFGTQTDALRIRAQIPGGKSEVQQLADLYLTVKDKMSPDKRKDAERIMKDKEIESYAKLRNELEKIN